MPSSPSSEEGADHDDPGAKVEFVKSFMVSLLATRPKLTRAQEQEQLRKREKMRERKRHINRLSAQRKRDREKEQMRHLTAEYQNLRSKNEALRFEHDHLSKLVLYARNAASDPATNPDDLSKILMTALHAYVPQQPQSVATSSPTVATLPASASVSASLPLEQSAPLTLPAVAALSAQAVPGSWGSSQSAVPFIPPSLSQLFQSLQHVQPNAPTHPPAAATFPTLPVQPALFPSTTSTATRRPSLSLLPTLTSTIPPVPQTSTGPTNQALAVLQEHTLRHIYQLLQPAVSRPQHHVQQQQHQHQAPVPILPSNLLSVFSPGLTPTAIPQTTALSDPNVLNVLTTLLQQQQQSVAAPPSTVAAANPLQSLLEALMHAQQQQQQSINTDTKPPSR